MINDLRKFTNVENILFNSIFLLTRNVLVCAICAVQNKRNIRTCSMGDLFLKSKTTTVLELAVSTVLSWDMLSFINGVYQVLEPRSPESRCYVFAH